MVAWGWMGTFQTTTELGKGVLPGKKASEVYRHQEAHWQAMTVALVCRLESKGSVQIGSERVLPRNILMAIRHNTHRSHRSHFPWISRKYNKRLKVFISWRHGHRQ